MALIFFPFIFLDEGLSKKVILPAAQAFLMLIAVVSVYASRAPWSNNTAKAFVWSVLVLPVIVNVVVPLFIEGEIRSEVVILCGLVFALLFWLNSAAKKCTV